MFQQTSREDGGWFGVSVPRHELLLGLNGDEWALNTTRVTAADVSGGDFVLTARKGTLVRVVPELPPFTSVSLTLLDETGFALWSEPDATNRPYSFRVLPGRYELIGDRGLPSEKRRSITIGSTTELVRWSP